MSDVPTPAPEMFAGLPGEVVEIWAPHTEASPVAIAAQFVVAFGNALGGGPRFYTGATAQRCNEFLIIGGATARARKGDAGNAVLSIFEEADPDWTTQCWKSGLSSGEGLIFHTRDKIEKKITEGKKKGEIQLVDEGVSDKRLLAYETEASAILKQADRKGNTLSNVTRDAWDHKRTLGTLTRREPLTATDAHISIIGHCTDEDLLAHITDTDVANGWANRFLFAKVHRAKLLPSSGRPDHRNVTAMAERVRAALEFGRAVFEVKRTPSAERLWNAVYPELTTDRPGLLGKLTARAEAHVVRLSMLFCLFRREREINDDALRSALAFWNYCFESTRLIFGTRTGNNEADRIKEDLLPGQRLSLSEIREEVFSGHLTATRLTAALDLLKRLEEVELQQESTGGRPVTYVYRFTHTERQKRWKSAESPEPFVDDAREAVGE